MIDDRATAFLEASVIERYPLRPPYADRVYEILMEGLPGTAARMLDLGCGPGKLAIGLARALRSRGVRARIDAIDVSPGMIAAARACALGDLPEIRWIGTAAEGFEPEARYHLVVAGASIHWMDQDRLLPQIRGWLEPEARLFVVDGDGALDPPWQAGELALLGDYIERLTGEIPDWASSPRSPLGLDSPILSHLLFRREGREVVMAAFEQSVADYVQCLHSRQTFCIERMGPARVRAFDAALTAILEPFARDGLLDFRYATRIEWGSIDDSRERRR